MAVADIAAAQHKQSRPRIKREFSPALQPGEVEPALMTSARRQRVIKVIADPELVARNPSDQAEIRCQRLLKLYSFLNGAVLGTAKAAAVEDEVEDFGPLEAEEAGIEVLQLSLRTGSRKP